MEQIRVGLIGAGGNTKSRHIPGFNKNKGYTITIRRKSIY